MRCLDANTSIFVLVVCSIPGGYTLAQQMRSSDHPRALELKVQKRVAVESGGERVVEELMRLPPDETALVTQHLWNVGEPDGPAVPDKFYVGMGSLANTRREQEINRTFIQPVLQAARRAGVLVVHSQPGFIAHKWPQYKALVAEMSRTPPQPVLQTPPASQYAQAEKDAWTVGSWPGWKYMNFPTPLRPLPHERVTMTSEELDHVLKRHGIKTLIYVGYATDMCLIGYTGGLQDMVTKFGYRAIVLREATLATEIGDGKSGVDKTRESLALIERRFASTACADEFVHAATANIPAQVNAGNGWVSFPVQRRILQSDGSERITTEHWTLPAGRVALVTMHLWNFGELGGPQVPPNICVADGTLANALRARRIDWSYIRPTLTAARRAGLAVIHAQPGWIATKYPQHQALLAEMNHSPLQPVTTAPALRECTADEMAKWTAAEWPQRANLDFPDLLKPLPTEPVVKTKEELDYVLRRQGITALIYVGYATNCCVMNYHCGLNDMVTSLGYPACLLREATLGTECPGEDVEKNTADALAQIERTLGWTASVHDFRAAALPARHNILSSHVGWIASRPNEPYYPADISDGLLEDWKSYFAHVHEIGFDEVGIFCFLTYNLPVPLGIDTPGVGRHSKDIRVTGDKLRKCREILAAAHARGMRIYYGLGLYSWDVADMRDAYPDASPDGKVLCGLYPGDPARKVPGSQQLMKDAVDFIVRELPDLDGWWLTSGDQGRCRCGRCNERFEPGVRGNAEYFLATDLPIIRYIRTRYPRMTIAYCTEVLNEAIEDPGNLDILQQIAGACDLYLWGHLQKDADATVQRLAAACPKTGILFYQRPWQSTPPTVQPRDGWFMPNMINWLGRELHRRGGMIPWAGLTACALPAGNACDELSMRLMVRLMDEPQRDPNIVLKELLQAWYAPRTQRALDELPLVFTEVEDAFRQRWPSWFMHIDMVPTRLGTLDKKRNWTPEAAVGYINANQRSLARLRAIKPELQNQVEVTRLEAGIVKWITYMKGQMKSEWKYEMP